MSDICDKTLSSPIVCKIKYLIIQISIGCVKQLNVVSTYLDILFILFLSPKRQRQNEQYLRSCTAVIS